MIMRGGSWNNNSENIRCSNRNNNNPNNRNNKIGFRCAQYPPLFGQNPAVHRTAGARLLEVTWRFIPALVFPAKQ